MRRIGNQVTFRGFYKIVQHKQDGSLHHRIGHIFQEIQIFRELIMVVQRKGHPRTVQRRDSPDAIHHSGYAERIGEVVHGPASCIVHLPGSNGSGNGQLVHEPGQRLDSFRQISGFGRPVVHLQVDVGVKVGIPWGVVEVVPDSLQIGWQLARRPGRVHQQVPAILVVKG